MTYPFPAFSIRIEGRTIIEATIEKEGRNPKIHIHPDITTLELETALRFTLERLIRKEFPALFYLPMGIQITPQIGGN